MNAIASSTNTPASPAGSPDHLVSTRQTVAARVIETNHHVLQALPCGSMNQDVATRFVEIDVKALRSITDKTERFFSAVSIGDNAHHQTQYRAELKRLAPEIAEETRTAFLESEQRMWNKEIRKAGELEQLRFRTVVTVHDPRTDAVAHKEAVHEHRDQTRRQAVQSAKTWARQGYWGSVYCQKTGECMEDFAPTSDDYPVEDVRLFNAIEKVTLYLPEVGAPLLREAADIEACKKTLRTAQAEARRCDLAITSAREALLKRIAKEFVVSEVEAADVMCTRSQYAVIQTAGRS